MMFSLSATARRCAVALFLTTAGLLSTACNDEVEDAQDYSAVDEAIITTYLSANNITNAQRQPSGLYYVPVLTDTTSTATRATVGRTVSVLYTGSFLNGTVFDATSRRGNTPFSFVLGRGQVISGWDEGIALMRKGEKAILLIPSALAYGPYGAGTIPPNTVLRFDVELVDVR